MPNDANKPENRQRQKRAYRPGLTVDGEEILGAHTVVKIDRQRDEPYISSALFFVFREGEANPCVLLTGEEIGRTAHDDYFKLPLSRQNIIKNPSKKYNYKDGSNIDKIIGIWSNPIMERSGDSLPRAWPYVKFKKPTKEGLLMDIIDRTCLRNIYNRRTADRMINEWYKDKEIIPPQEVPPLVKVPTPKERDEWKARTRGLPGSQSNFTPDSATLGRGSVEDRDRTRKNWRNTSYGRGAYNDDTTNRLAILEDNMENLKKMVVAMMAMMKNMQADSATGGPSGMFVPDVA